MLHRIAGWWDALELWVVGLPFVPQVVLVVGVMIPVSYLIAKTMDRVLAGVLDWVRPDEPSASKNNHRTADLLPGGHGSGVN